MRFLCARFAETSAKPFVTEKARVDCRIYLAAVKIVLSYTSNKKVSTHSNWNPNLQKFKLIKSQLLFGKQTRIYRYIAVANMPHNMEALKGQVE